MTTNEFYIALKALLLNYFASNYPTGVILNGFQNNTVMPSDGKQIIMTKLNTRTLPLEPEYNYDQTNEIEQYITLSSIETQVDFYGSPASDTADQLKLILESALANNFFIANDYDLSVHKVEDVINLSGTFGRDLYLSRYTLKFSLFGNIEVDNANPAIDTVGLNIRYAPIQTSL